MKICSLCNSDNTYVDKKGRSRWYKFKDGYICQKCYNNKVLRPRLTKEQIQKYNEKFNTVKYRKKYNSTIVNFKDKLVYVKKTVRIGKCQKCGKKIGDEYVNWKGEIAIIKRTGLHHEEYHDDDVLKDTVELCTSCHGKLSVLQWRLEQ